MMPKCHHELLGANNFEFRARYDAKLEFGGIYTIWNSDLCWQEFEGCFKKLHNIT